MHHCSILRTTITGKYEQQWALKQDCRDQRGDAAWRQAVESNAIGGAEFEMNLP